MKFRKISFGKNGVISVELNKKLEYFHHYWSLVLHTEEKDKALLLDISKFESHRSLLEKCKIEIESSGEGVPSRAINNINKLYFSSPLFSKENLFLNRGPNIQKKLNALKRDFQNKSVSSKEKALLKIEELENLILQGKDEDYPSFLVESLVQIFDKSKILNHNMEVDIEFLVNALIVELFHVGYSTGFIRRMPDVILFVDSGFPNEIFEDKKAPKNRDKITLRTRLKGFGALLSRKQSKGYFIFKVDGIDFQLEEPMKIWGSEIYNPQTHTKVNKVDVEDWVYQSWLKSELFYEGDDKSTCNIIVPTKYHNEGSRQNDEKDLYTAFGRAQDSLNVLNKVRNSIDIFNKRHNGSIDIRNRILISTDYYSVKSPHYSFNKTETLSLEIPQVRMVQDTIDYINCLNPDNQFHQKIIGANSLLKRYRDGPWEFKFNELWIKVFESFFPNDLEGIKQFSFKCLMLRYDRQYINHVKGFFYGALGRGNNPLEKPCYSFSEEEKIKLEIRFLETGDAIIAGDAFKSNFMNISRTLDIRVLNKNLQMAQYHMGRKGCFIKNIEGWVNSLIDQVYAQRNLYTHSNSVDEFGAMKLKEDIIYLANVVIGVIQSKIYGGSEVPIKDIENEFMRIKETYDK